MNFTTAAIPAVFYEPTHLMWKIEDHCGKCPKVDNVCIRPFGFGKPVFCVHKFYGVNFHEFLEAPPDDGTDRMLLMLITAMLGVLLLIQVKGILF
jgi:hypothetical protein